MPCSQTELIREHRRLAKVIASQFFLPGAERQDVEQEAMIGLWIAARDYDGRGQFEPFARLVIKRRLLTCIRIANQLNRRGLNEAYRNEGFDRLVDHRADPSNLVEKQEELRRIVATVPTLSELERRALAGVLNGERYEDIGPFKSVDNAAQRARRKLAKAA